ncbi:cytochrome b/b6 domain-containing protein [Ruania halotolerans]|uniref:cytochrome b/b6 domain-containing protein n=1 Tax=Ruania halotolerans TaxID=2897773 RepID=UPI001E3E3251|nr:cytochrome b/b6 domain-containing protein [Ruania halotolerans]UFU06316.1 hypothetical protein LQF10_18120 [Ruania halotolerans]
MSDDPLDSALADRARRLQRSLASPVRNTRMAVVIGRLLGLAVVLCFLTGLYSHLLQEPPDWITFPTRPTELYRWTQGIHVTAGTAIFPLLLAKLWSVYPRLFAWPPVTSWPNALERLSIGALVSATLLEVVIGLINTYQWYPWPFSFRAVHYGLAWVIVGSLLVHVAVKLPEIREHWRRTAEEPEDLSGEEIETPAEHAEEKS